MATANFSIGRLFPAIRCLWIGINLCRGKRGERWREGGKNRGREREKGEDRGSRREGKMEREGARVSGKGRCAGWERQYMENEGEKECPEVAN